MHIATQNLFYASFCLAIARTSLGDPMDWVRPDYVANAAKKFDSATSDSQQAIIRNAAKWAKKGPFSVTDNNGIRAPSGDPRDYVSWPPYWWPDCNWCSAGGRNHLAHPGSGSPNGTDDNSTGDADQDPDSPEDDDFNEESSDSPVLRRHAFPRFSQSLHRIVRVRRSLSDSTSPTSTSTSSSSAASEASVLVYDAILPLPQAPLGDPSVTIPTSGIAPAAPHTTAERTAGTAAPPQNAAKTRKPSCNPSPTTSMAPSATWTTCPYVNRDGKANPDVRNIKDPRHILHAGQSIIDNSIAYALTQRRSHSQVVVEFVNALLLDAKTGMNPHAKYGQIVRGPPPKGSTGSFTGILDMRGLVPIYNGVAILKAANSMDWTQELDQALKTWAQEWANWMTSSDLGKMAGSRPNNHGTFYTYHLAAVLLAIGDVKGAITVIEKFLAGPFREQIAASGEQPYEAARTRPYHYRAFNLEAMIGVAKIGDQIGVDVWNARSKYKATIQTAVDFAMKQNPKHEDGNQLVRHVAAIAAAYGDARGNYAAFLRAHSPGYQSQAFWFYDQTDALRNAPANRKRRREVVRRQGSVQDGSPILFTCPFVGCEVIDEGLCVTCDELRPLYETPVIIDSD